MQELHSLDALADRLRDAPEAIRQEGARVLEEVGDDLLSAVSGRIGGSGRIAGVQSRYLGSGRGYVAVRPRADTDIGGYPAGYVTNALESGHRQTPGRYIPTIGAALRYDRTAGKFMYEKTRDHDAPRAAEEAARRLEAIAASIVEGGGQ